jgi:hypothetical protein
VTGGYSASYTLGAHCPAVGARLGLEGEVQAERFNEALEMQTAARKGTRKRKPALPRPIDLEAIREAAQSTAPVPRESADRRGAG